MLSILAHVQNTPTVDILFSVSDGPIFFAWIYGPCLGQKNAFP